MEEELKGKRGKVYVASGTPPPPAKVARKSVVVHRSKKHKKEHTEKENAETETADLEYKEKNRRDKKSPKPEYAPRKFFCFKIGKAYSNKDLLFRAPHKTDQDQELSLCSNET